jgi:hypothetical protein
VGPITVTVNPGSDTGSGLSLATAQLARASASLSGGVCAALGTYVAIATAPASLYTDSGLPTGHCYDYEYIVADNVGNQVTYTSSVAQIP